MGNTTFFADRVFITINGNEVMHAKSATIRRTKNLQRVDTMTRNKRSAGYKYGNTHVSLSLGLDIEQKRAQIDPALASDDADISVVAEAGGERYIITGVRESEMSINGSVGDAGKELQFEGLDIVNENGTSVNIAISLA